MAKFHYYDFSAFRLKESLHLGCKEAQLTVLPRYLCFIYGLELRCVLMCYI